MREDPVRALRAVRFAARLGFTIEPEVFEAMRRHAGELARCAPPRVLEEIFKILRCTGASRAFELLRSAGLLPVILPALSQALDAGGRRRGPASTPTSPPSTRLVREGEEVSDAMLLGALLIHLRAGPGRGARAADLTCSPSWSRPRGCRARWRSAPAWPCRPRSSSTGRPRRRRRRGGLAGQAYFTDALQLLAGDREGHRARAPRPLARWEAEAAAAQPGDGGRARGGDSSPSLLAEAAGRGDRLPRRPVRRPGPAPAPDGAGRRGRRRPPPPPRWTPPPPPRDGEAGGAPQAAPPATLAGPRSRDATFEYNAPAQATPHEDPDLPAAARSRRPGTSASSSSSRARRSWATASTASRRRRSSPSPRT